MSPPANLSIIFVPLLSFSLSTCLSSIHHLPIQQSIIYLAICSFTYIDLSTCVCNLSSILIYLPVFVTYHPSIHHLPIHWSIIYPSIVLSISICISITYHLSILLVLFLWKPLTGTLWRGGPHCRAFTGRIPDVSSISVLSSCRRLDDSHPGLQSGWVHSISPFFSSCSLLSVLHVRHHVFLFPLQVCLLSSLTLHWQSCSFCYLNTRIH